MADLQKNQYNFADLKAEYVAKRKELEDLLEEAANIDLRNHSLKHEIVSTCAKLEGLKFLIPERNKLFNDAIDSHTSLLTSIKSNIQQRSRLATLIKTKISKMKEEAEQIKVNIAKQKEEAQQLQVSIEELKKTSKDPLNGYEMEIAVIQALQLVAEKRAAELRKREQVEKELIQATELKFIQVNDELQLLKQKYSEEEGSMTELKLLREKEKDLVNQQVNSLVEIEVLRKAIMEVAETSNTDKENLKSVVEKLQAEKDNLLAQQHAQDLVNDMVIANLQGQLKEVALANDVENEAANSSTYVEQINSQNSVRSDTSKKMQSTNRYLQSPK